MRLHEYIRRPVWALGGLCVFIVWKSYALTPAEQALQQSTKKVLSQLQKDPKKAQKLCENTCNRFSVSQAPDVACSLCYDTCQSIAKAGNKTKNVLAQRMIRKCNDASYTEASKRQETAKALIKKAECLAMAPGQAQIEAERAKYSVLDVKCKQLKLAAERLQEQLAYRMEKAGDATTQIIGLQKDIGRLQTTLSTQQQQFEKNLQKALSDKDAQSKAQLAQLEKNYEAWVAQEQRNLKALQKQYGLLKQDLEQAQKESQEKCTKKDLQITALQKELKLRKQETQESLGQYDKRVMQLQKYLAHLQSPTILPIALPEIKKYEPYEKRIQPEIEEEIPIKEPIYIAPPMADLTTEWLINRIRQQAAPSVPEIIREPMPIEIPVAQEIEAMVPEVLETEESWWDRLAKSYSEYEPYGWGGLGA